MYNLLEADKVYDINDDEDPDAIPTVSVDDNHEESSVTNKNTDNAKGGVEGVVVNKDAGDGVPYEWSFKGYIAFALWGHIPIPGGEKYKSLVMFSVDGDYD